MKSKNLKVYQFDGKEYVFNHNKFSDLCATKSGSRKQKKSSIAFLLYISEQLDYEASESTIKGWMFGNNSPGNIDMVKKIANVFKLDIYDLLVEVRKDKKMNNNINLMMDEKVRETVKAIYEGFVDFIDEYIFTEGFSWKTDLLFDDCGNPLSPMDEYPNYIQMDRKQMTLIKKARVYLPGDVVENLKNLMRKINGSGSPFDTLEERTSDDEIFLLDSEEIELLKEPSEYEIFVENKNRDNPYVAQAFLNFKVSEFYSELDDILVDYLP